jgi:RNA polymerase sigma factor (sigma-70 family)
VSKSSRGSEKSAEGPVEDLLEQLSSHQPEPAWNEFLKRFSPLIFRVAHRYEHDEERVSDCFLFVCGQLSDNAFRRLRSFRPDRPARFRTWLTSVVTNLCVDWRRKLHGRYRPTAAIARLPELDQIIYRFIYIRGMTRQQCLRVLEPRFPDLTDPQLSDINARLFSLLTSSQRWQMGARTRGSISLDEASTPDEDDAPIQPEDPGPGPDTLAQAEQERSLLETGMARLPPRQRLLLRLRFQQDLTLEEVARLTRIPDPYRANREIQAALAALAQLLKSPES